MVITTQLILLFVNPSLLIDLHWSVHDDSCGSDHFLIFVNTNENDSIKNWNFRKFKFENLCSKTILVERFENQADSIQKSTDTLTRISNKCIPKTSTNSKRIKNPCFTEECKEAIKAREKKHKGIHSYGMLTVRDKAAADYAYSWVYTRARFLNKEYFISTYILTCSSIFNTKTINVN